MIHNEKIREDRTRSIARRLGLRIVKSRHRSPVSSGGFLIVDTETNSVMAGGWPFPYALDLDEVNDVLTAFALAE